ncbi:MAG: universal stress protein [Muricauda sp. TMED12]|jgi:nucleotide-binding universal stress UspA family protein|nr:MAG: universal stress protein [Muricauda sp. TMED12]|tara:strand:- start:248 stop:1087 length:840 start_codon:yes stop_codon:yes gene_type:complete
MKKVLLPTDFSTNAYNAILYALKLYGNTSCVFYLMHSYMVPIYTSEYNMANPLGMDLLEIYKKQAMDQLTALKEELLLHHKNPKHRFEVHSAFGILTDEIWEFVRKEEIDVVVMGTQGATGAKEVLLGSNTVHTIKKAICPVIAVPEDFAYENPKQILFPTDFEVDYKAQGIEELLYLAKEHIGFINVLHMGRGERMKDFQNKNKEFLDQRLKPVAHLFHETPNNEVVEGINEYQLKNKVNLLVMIMNKHTFLESLFIKPVIRKIGLHLHIPFMVIPQF